MSGRIAAFLLVLAPTACPPDAARAGVIFADDFETTVNTRNWQVYQRISDGAWHATEGAGIEVQTSGTVVDAHSGNQYIELDSDRRRGGANDATNSAMTRRLTDLDAGRYELDYYYQARTGRENDNVVGVYFDDGDTLFDTLVDTANGVGSNGWIRHSVPLIVDRDGATRYLSFRGMGTANGLGGFVDSVSLTYAGGTRAGGTHAGGTHAGRAPEPLGIGFVGLGIAGMVRRRRRVAPERAGAGKKA